MRAIFKCRMIPECFINVALIQFNLLAYRSEFQKSFSANKKNFVTIRLYSDILINFRLNSMLRVSVMAKGHVESGWKVGK